MPWRPPAPAPAPPPVAAAPHIASKAGHGRGPRGIDTSERGRAHKHIRYSQTDTHSGSSGPRTAAGRPSTSSAAGRGAQRIRSERWIRSWYWRSRFRSSCTTGSTRRGLIAVLFGPMSFAAQQLAPLWIRFCEAFGAIGLGPWQMAFVSRKVACATALVACTTFCQLALCSFGKRRCILIAMLAY